MASARASRRTHETSTTLLRLPTLLAPSAACAAHLDTSESIALSFTRARCRAYRNARTPRESRVPDAPCLPHAESATTRVAACALHRRCATAPRRTHKSPRAWRCYPALGNVALCARDSRRSPLVRMLPLARPLARRRIPRSCCLPAAARVAFCHASYTLRQQCIAMRHRWKARLIDRVPS